AVGAGGGRLRVEAYLPQSQVLPRVDLLVSHGGAGTTLGSLVPGVPHLVVPGFAPSQLRNAERTEALGLGLAVPQAGMTAATLRAAARALLADHRYTGAAAATRAALDRLPDVDS